MNKTTHHIVIIGVSSFIGAEIAKALARKNYCTVSGTYRRANDRLVQVRAAFSEEDREIRLDCIDVTQPDQIKNYFESLSPALVINNRMSVVYCCGVWVCGKLSGMDEHKQSNAINVGLIAQINVLRMYLRSGMSGKIILLTGLGGEKNSVKGNSIYGVITNGVYSLVRSVGMEIAHTDTACIAIAIGLFDKGQKYIHDLCSQLCISKPSPVDDIRDLIVSQLLSDSNILNGSVVEVSNGMFNYEKTIEYLESEDAKHG